MTGMSIDYMHCILLGVMRLLFRLWTSSSNHRELWYIGNQITTLDNRLCSIKPPNEIQRTPRSIEFTLKFWKGYLKSVAIVSCICNTLHNAIVFKQRMPHATYVYLDVGCGNTWISFSYV